MSCSDLVNSSVLIDLANLISMSEPPVKSRLGFNPMVDRAITARTTVIADIEYRILRLAIIGNLA